MGAADGRRSDRAAFPLWRSGTYGEPENLSSRRRPTHYTFSHAEPWQKRGPARTYKPHTPLAEASCVSHNSSFEEGRTSPLAELPLPTRFAEHDELEIRHLFVAGAVVGAEAFAAARTILGALELVSQRYRRFHVA